MIRKLRIKFTLVAIFSSLIVLIVLVGGTDLLNYRKVVDDSDKILKILSDNDGHFPVREMPDNAGEPRPRDDFGMRRTDSPEIAFETRYFSVRFDPSGSVTSVDTEMIAAVSDDLAEEYAKSVYNGARTKGFIRDYRFISVDTSYGGKLIIFCDCGAGLSNFRNFTLVSLIVSFACLVLVSIAAALISGRAVRPVAESYEKQKRFITDAGHEIKTPLAIINADADVLIAENGEDNEWVNDIKKQTARLSELTNDLIFLSKMEEGGEPSVSSKIDLSDVLSDRVSSFKAVALAGGKTITTNIDKDVFINGDPDRVSELINILLDNAVKYSPEGKEIFAGCSLRGKTAVLEVENESSSRLTDKDLDSLFDRFYRADRSRNSQSGGFGIGLSVAHAIVRSMDGKILVQRKDNGRILFSVSVPAVV